VALHMDARYSQTEQQSLPRNPARPAPWVAHNCLTLAIVG
jgi:hypothetical protein